MPTFKAGKNGRIVIQGNNMANKVFTANFEGDELDVSNFEGNGRKSWLIGLLGLRWTVAPLWDSAANPLSNPPGLYPRDDGTDMKLYASRQGQLNKYWNMPTWMCSKSDMNVDVANYVQFNASGAAQEDFVYTTVA